MLSSNIIIIARIAKRDHNEDLVWIYEASCNKGNNKKWFQILFRGKIKVKHKLNYN